MNEIHIDTQMCRHEAGNLRKTAGLVQDIKDRLTSLAGLTADAWQGDASNALSDAQEYTLKEITLFIALVEDAADAVESVAMSYEQAEKNLIGYMP